DGDQHEPADDLAGVVGGLKGEWHGVRCVERQGDANDKASEANDDQEKPENSHKDLAGGRAKW
ncbi:MAG: hypothetical protein ACREL2_06955, partial [Gemmatimonadales bacterium]